MKVLCACTSEGSQTCDPLKTYKHFSVHILPPIRSQLFGVSENILTIFSFSLGYVRKGTSSNTMRFKDFVIVWNNLYARVNEKLSTLIRNIQN